MIYDSIDQFDDSTILWRDFLTPDWVLFERLQTYIIYTLLNFLVALGKNWTFYRATFGRKSTTPMESSSEELCLKWNKRILRCVLNRKISMVTEYISYQFDNSLPCLITYRLIAGTIIKQTLNIYLIFNPYTIYTVNLSSSLYFHRM